jgi:sterol desaturase/sphingolipid hydroxylase (fatty acid hydroxylase superfamily)
MFDWAHLGEKVFKAFGELLSLQGGLHWLPLAWAVVIAFLVYRVRLDRNQTESSRGFFAFCFPKQVYSSASAKLDFKYLVVETVVYGGFIAPLLLSSMTAAHAVLRLLVEIFGVPITPLSRSIFTDVGFTIALALAVDFGFFSAHYLQHRVSFLWEFHKVHHSAEVLHPVTAYRSHPVDEALDATFVGGATGIVLGLSAYAFGTPILGITLLEVNAIVFLFTVAGSHLRHSHVWLSYGPILDRVFVSPAMHQIHHSCAPQHLDKNLGGMFTVWDWLAGTLYLPRRGEELPLGLQSEEHREYTSVLRLYLLPFAKIIRRLIAVYRHQVTPALQEQPRTPTSGHYKSTRTE